MKTAIVFAGQGSQKKGMGKDFFDSYDEFKKDFLAEDDIKEKMFNGDLEELSRTDVTQPALVAFGLGVYNLISNLGVKANYYSGLSLGEYTALGASGAFSQKKAYEYAKFRGKVMNEAGGDRDISMAAVFINDPSKLQKACDISRDKGLSMICNYNCPGQYVIGGDRLAVEETSNIVKNMGARRVIPLNVTGAFHTPYMNEASSKLESYFNTEKIENKDRPVVFNTLGRPKEKNENIKDILVKQVSSPIYFEKCIEYMLQNGVKRFIEIGPGKALSGFIKKTDKTVEVHSIESVETFEKFKEVINNGN